MSLIWGKNAIMYLFPFTHPVQLTEVNVSSSVSSKCKDRPSETPNSQFPRGECFALGSNFCNLEISKLLRNFRKYVVKFQKCGEVIPETGKRSQEK